MPKDTIWECAPHTKAKHQLLKNYLDAWFPILGRYNGKIVFIDGFAGPGIYTDGEVGSPLIAIRSAFGQQAFIGDTEILFLFIEKDQKRLDSLLELVSNEQKPESFKTHCVNDDFLEIITSELDELDSNGKNNAPIFAFIDPFGFSQVPYKLLKRLLQRDKTEAFIYFPRDHVNRFLEQDKVKTHIQSLFGLDEIVLPEGSGNRLEQVKVLYHNQLKKIAKYVGSFTMKDMRNHPIYDLFFVSNHRLGFVKMKEAMWAVDKSGGFSFSDRTNQSQIILFQPDPVEELVNRLKVTGAGKTAVTFDELETYFVENTNYLATHVKNALKRLEAQALIKCKPLKTDGTKRRNNTFPSGTIIDFLP
jgi:three-Cys-motif partner protein